MIPSHRPANAVHSTAQYLLDTCNWSPSKCPPCTGIWEPPKAPEHPSSSSPLLLLECWSATGLLQPPQRSRLPCTCPPPIIHHSTDWAESPQNQCVKKARNTSQMYVHNRNLLADAIRPPPAPRAHLFSLHGNPPPPSRPSRLQSAKTPACGGRQPSDVGLNCATVTPPPHTHPVRYQTDSARNSGRCNNAIRRLCIAVLSKPGRHKLLWTGYPVSYGVWYGDRRGCKWLNQLTCLQYTRASRMWIAARRYTIAAAPIPDRQRIEEVRICCPSPEQ